MRCIYLYCIQTILDNIAKRQVYNFDSWAFPHHFVYSLRIFLFSASFYHSHWFVFLVEVFISLVTLICFDFRLFFVKQLQQLICHELIILITLNYIYFLVTIKTLRKRNKNRKLSKFIGLIYNYFLLAGAITDQKKKKTSNRFEWLRVSVKKSIENWMKP